MIEVYYKKYSGKITTEISYYFDLNTRGIRKYYETIYEYLSDGGYQYSKYTVELDNSVKSAERIENDVYKYTSLLFSNIKAQRRLSVLTKFILYVISEINNIPIYKLVKKIEYYHNGISIQLSANAFVKTTYTLIPRFEKVYKEQ